MATTLAAVALAIAIVALALNFVVPGPTGAAGTSAPQGTGVYWAAVNDSGPIVRGSGAAGAILLPDGNTFAVLFTQNVSHCGLAATVADNAPYGQPPASLVSVGTLAKDPDAVLVSTWGLPYAFAENYSFNVGAFCSGYSWAAVAATGAVNESSGVSSASLGAAGNYTVKFSSDVASCAFLATIGSNTPGAPPSGSAAAAGIKGESNEASVTTYNGTGVPTDEPFYITAVCHGQYDVVSVAGAQIVGTGNGSIPEGTGTFQSNFTTAIWDCAFFATLGHPESSGNAAVNAIALTGRNSNPYALWIDEDSPAGVPAGSAYQSAAFC